MKPWTLALVVAALALLPAVALGLDERYAIDLATRLLIYAIAAMSLDLVLGYGGLVSFGHAAFLGAGAYGVAILTSHHQQGDWLWGAIPGSDALWVTLPVGVLLAGLAAAIMGVFSLRTSGVYFIMITLAFSQMLYYLMISSGRYGGEDGVVLWQRNTLPGLDLGSDIQFYYLVLLLLLGFSWLCWRLVRSPFGLLLQGCRQNPRRLQTLGYPIFRYQLVAFMISAMGAGLAGALLANQSEYVSPALLHWTQSGELMIMVILGGRATLWGPALGAVVLLLLEETLAAVTDYWGLPLGALLLLAVLYLRGGIGPALAGGRRD